MNQFKNLKVLIVDGDLDAAQRLVQLVGMYGHEVRLACDGRSALRQIRDEDFQLVLLDIDLPDMDGYELARRLTLLGQCRLSLVALTRAGEDKYPRRSGSAALDGHMVKPCQSDARSQRELSDQLEQVLQRAMTWAADRAVSHRRLSAA